MAQPEEMEPDPVPFDYVQPTPNGGTRTRIWPIRLGNGAEMTVRVESPAVRRKAPGTLNSIVTVWIGQERVGYWSHVPAVVDDIIDTLNQALAVQSDG